MWHVSATERQNPTTFSVVIRIISYGETGASVSLADAKSEQSGQDSLTEREVNDY